MAVTEGSLPVILVLIGVVVAILVYNLQNVKSQSSTGASIGGGFHIYRNNNRIITFICVAIIMYLLYQKVYPGAMKM
jgi:hypothetical protein